MVVTAPPCIPLHPQIISAASSLDSAPANFLTGTWPKNCRCTRWFQRPPSLGNWSEPRGPFHLPGAELINHHFRNLA